MNIIVNDRIGLDPKKALEFVSSLLDNRKPENGSLDYGLETHGKFIEFGGLYSDVPIQVYQSGKRKTAKSPIKIIIEEHIPY